MCLIGQSKNRILGHYLIGFRKALEAKNWNDVQKNKEKYEGKECRSCTLTAPGVFGSIRSSFKNVYSCIVSEKKQIYEFFRYSKRKRKKNIQKIRTAKFSAVFAAVLRGFVRGMKKKFQR